MKTSSALIRILSAALLSGSAVVARAESGGLKAQQALPQGAKAPEQAVSGQTPAAATVGPGILLTKWRTGNFISTATVRTQVPLDDTSALQASFKTYVANQPVVIVYNAECAGLASTANNDDYLSIEIIVDGRPASPKSGTAFAFCTSESTSEFNWVGAVRQSVIGIPTAGTHTIQIFATPESLSEWWLGDTSLVIYNTK